MNLMSKLALRHMGQNRKRSLFTVAAIVLSVAMITAVSCFVFSFQDAFQSLLKQSGGDFHAVASGVSNEQADLILSDAMVESGYIREEDGVVSVYFRLAQPNKGLDQGQKVISRYGAGESHIRFNVELLAAEGYLIGTFMLVLYAIGAFLGLIIMAGSIIVIANAFAISTGERVRQFGILKSAGATSEQIRMSVLVEGVMLSVIGIPLGILVGLIVEVIGVSIANTLMSGMENTNILSVAFRVVISPAAILISAAASFITVLLSAWFPARRASKISAIDAIRQSGEIKIKPRSVRTSHLTQRVFGFEGTLAAKALKRSRRKYRATVISIVVSIVFVLISASFGEMLFSVIQVVYPDINATAIVTPRSGIAMDEVKWYTDRISGFPGADLRMIGLADSSIEAAGNPYAEETKKYWNSERPERATLICLDEVSYAALCEQAGVPAGSSILLNYGIARYEGKRIEFEPFQFAPATYTIPKQDGSRLSLDVSGQTTAPSSLLKDYSTESQTNIIVPITVLQDAGLAVRAVWFTNVPDAIGFLKYADERLQNAKDAYETSNVQAESAMIGNVYLLVMIFIYGFTGLLSLIGITSVISTISTNIRLRAQEFAVLQSVGMAPVGLRKMLNLESLLYSLKSLLIGLPMGVGLSYGLHYLFSMIMSFAFLVPWAAIGICVLAVMAITFASMRYAVRQLNSGNIVEAMRRVAV